MEVQEVLRDFGLTEQEARVYMMLLQNGPSLAGVISRKTGIHRRNVYDITDRLAKKGIIGYIVKNNRRLFEAANPEKFLDILKEKENSVRESMNYLSEMYSGIKEKQETIFYKGKGGLKTVFQDQLENNKGKEILILGASESAFDILPFYFKWYDKDRVKERIRVRIISSGNLKKRVPLSEIRYLPEKYANPLAINIYKDKVAIILWKKEPFVIVIKEKEVAESYRKYFELMWHSAKKRI